MNSGSSAPAASDRGWRSKTFGLVAVIVLIAGLSLLGFFGVRSMVDRSSANDTVEARDAVTIAASEIVQNVFSFHYEDVDASLARLEESSTGNFLTEQRQFSDDVRARVEEQKAVVTAVISNTAVSELDTDEGTASVLVVFTATSEREGEEDIVRRQSSVVELVWEEDRWKAAEVSQVGLSVPVGADSQSVRALEESIGAPGGAVGAGDSESGDSADDGDEGP